MTSNLRILLAEDNEVNQHLMLRILNRIGYNAVLAKNGIQVLNKMDKQDYDLILMDIQMPGMDGITATKLIRAHYAPEKQPAIYALTADTADEGLDRYMAAGMNGMLSKPIQVDDLRRVIEKVANKTQEQESVEIHSDNKASALTSYPVLDTEVLGDFMKLMGEDGQDSARHLIELYQQGTPELLQKIQTAYSQNDLDDLLKLVHTLKGSSSQIGARRMEQFCVRLEVLLKQSGIEPFTTFLPGIKQEYTVLSDALEEFMAGWN